MAPRRAHSKRSVETIVLWSGEEAERVLFSSRDLRTLWFSPLRAAFRPPGSLLPSGLPGKGRCRGRCWGRCRGPFYTSAVLSAPPASGGVARRFYKRLRSGTLHPLHPSAVPVCGACDPLCRPTVSTVCALLPLHDTGDTGVVVIGESCGGKCDFASSPFQAAILSTHL